MSEKPMLRRLWLSLKKQGGTVKLSLADAKPATGSFDIVALVSSAGAPFDATLQLARAVDIQEKTSGGTGLITFTFPAGLFSAAPDVTPRIKGPAGLIGATCEVVSVSAALAVIRVVKIAAVPIVASGVTVSLRAEATT